jgi:hypothetical protein
LAFLGDDCAGLGRWAEKAVVVVLGETRPLVESAGAVLNEVSPRLMALAGDEADVEMAFEALRERLDGTVLMALERGMAVEI